jgi:hypothetical protein
MTEKEFSGGSDRIVGREGETYGEAIAVGEPFIGKRSGETVQETEPIAAWLNGLEARACGRIVAQLGLSRDKGRGFIVDGEMQGMRRYGRAYDDGMSGFITIPVHHHIGQGLFHAQLHGKPDILAEGILVGEGLYPWLHTAQLRELAVQLKAVLRRFHQHLRLHTRRACLHRAGLLLRFTH